MQGQTLTDLNPTRALFGRMVSDLVRDVGGPGFFWQLGVLALCVALAWPLARRVAGRLEARYAGSSFALRFAASSLERAMFPLFGWLLVLLARFALDAWMSVSVLRLALVPLFGIAFLYVAFYVLRRVLSGNGQLHGMLVLVEKVLTTAVWACMALYVLGLLGDVVGWLDSIQFSLGKQSISVADLMMACLWILLTVLAALWFGSWLEERLMRSAAIDSNLRVVLTRLSKALLLLISLLFSLSLVGIDLTVLSVFGGALGVGLGLGLQKIASNYVSGFIILLDHSVKLGDQITVDKYSGIVSQIRTRYTVVRNSDGETLVPNEQLVAQAVQNQSFSKTNVRVSTRVIADYGTDPETVLGVLARAVAGLPRLLAEPAPSAFLVAFVEKGIEYEVAGHIADPQNGKLGVQSAMNRAIWKALKEHGISTPYSKSDTQGTSGAQQALPAQPVAAPAGTEATP